MSEMKTSEKKVSKTERKNIKVDLAKFVLAWQKAETPEEAAKAVGVYNEKGEPDAEWARGRAASLRKNNVPLKVFPAKRGPSIDYAALAALVKGK